MSNGLDVTFGLATSGFNVGLGTEWNIANPACFSNGKRNRGLTGAYYAKLAHVTGGISRGLIFQRHDCAAILAKRRHSLQITIGLRHRHHWTITIDGVAAGSKVPASAFRLVGNLGSGGLPHRRGAPGGRRTEKKR